MGCVHVQVVAARRVVDHLVERGFKEGHVAYGINTGFGLFADVIIGHDKLKKLQVAPTFRTKR